MKGGYGGWDCKLQSANCKSKNDGEVAYPNFQFAFCNRHFAIFFSYLPYPPFIPLISFQYPLRYSFQITIAE